MDWDNDGIEDIISGSYDPGDIWLFRGRGKGRYAKGVVLEDADGTPMVHHPKELLEYHRLREEKGESDNATLQARVASFGSWPAPVDWDGDGDLDLLIGSFRGSIYLRTNEGTRKKPKFAPKSTDIGIKVPMHAAPVVADWNGDGTWDLVVGAGDGSVTFYQNTGSADAPEFADGRVLVEAKNTTKSLRQYVGKGDTAAPGVRAQICVVDYDLDGKLDLLVGDYSTVFALRNDLSDADLAEARKLIARAGELDADPQAGRQERKTVTDKLQSFVSGESRRTSHVWLYRRISP